MRAVLAALLLASPLAGCVVGGLPHEAGAGAGVAFPDAPAPRSASAAARERDAGDVILVLPEQADPAYEAYRGAMRGDDGIEPWVAYLNGELALRRDVPIEMTACGMQNAFYDPATRRVTLCYEFLDVAAYAMSDPSLSEEAQARATGGAWLFILLHELGHALVDAHELPATGREEDAVDDFASVMLVRAGATDALLDAAAFWAALDDGQVSAEEFADEHSLTAQRYYALLCNAFGSDPEGYGWIVDEGYLPSDRAARCPREWERKDFSWERLMEPWTKTDGPDGTMIS